MISDICISRLCGRRTFPRELDLSFAHIYGKRCFAPRRTRTYV